MKTIYILAVVAVLTFAALSTTGCKTSYGRVGWVTNSVPTMHSKHDPRGLCPECAFPPYLSGAGRQQF